MRLDLIVVKNKKKEKIQKFVVIFLILIVVFTLVFIVNKVKVDEQIKTISLSSENENRVIKKKVKIQRNISLLPDYTDIGKERMNNLYIGSEKTVYLTFDDGPSRTVTPLILDLLKQEGIKATFFVLGSRVEFYPDLVKQEFEQGHFIANHGYSHVYDSIYSVPEAVLDEYTRTENLIKQAIGVSGYNSHLFRFPGGSYGGKYSEIKRQAIEILKQNNIEFINWNALTNDAAGANTKEALMENLIETVGEKTNVVILMHDAGDKILTYEILPDVINYLREKGYTFKNFYSIMK